MIKLLSYILFEKYIYILALEMASPRNQHCANCIGTLSLPTVYQRHGTLLDYCMGICLGFETRRPVGLYLHKLESLVKCTLTFFY